MPLKNQLDTPESEGELAATPGRLPVHFRSQHTVHRVLDAASSLLQQMPLEDVTTTRIATEAGVSIGGLYRFFPDKQSIIDAIAVRSVDEFRTTVESKLAQTGGVDPREFLDLVIDAYVAFLASRPDFRAIALGRHVSQATRER